jgi:hypothetical protein
LGVVANGGIRRKQGGKGGTGVDGVPHATANVMGGLEFPRKSGHQDKVV